MHPRGNPPSLSHLAHWSACALSLAACSAPLPSPAAAVSTSASYHHAPDIIGASDVAWWRQWQDPVLSSLIERATNDAGEVGIALARLEAARAEGDGADAWPWPIISAQLADAQERSGLDDRAKSAVPDTHARRAALALRWEPDVFGAQRAAAQAAAHTTTQAQGALANARLQVAGELAQLYFGVRAAQSQQPLLDAAIATLHRSEQLLARQASAGQASTAQVQAAHAAAESLAAQQPALAALIAAGSARIATLTAQDPSAFTLKATTTPYRWPAFAAVPTGQPSELLQRRPDVMAAQARRDAELARSRQVRRASWPRLFFDAVGGRQQLHLNGSALATAGISSVAATFVMPVATAGRIDAGIAAQDARLHEADQHFALALRSAIAEVESALASLQAQQGRTRHLQAATQAQRATWERTVRRYRAGETDRLTLLVAERTTLQAQLAELEGHLALAQDSVRAWLALGGGWCLPGMPERTITTPTEVPAAPRCDDAIATTANRVDQESLP